MFVYVRISPPVTRGDSQVGSFVTQWHKKHAHFIHFYTNTRVFIPAMMFYDVKP